MPANIPSAPLAAGCLASALVAFVPAILNDSDTLWQIRTGEWILDHRAIPTTDPFSFTAGARTWLPHEWLAEVFMAIAYRFDGLRGVVCLAALATGTAAGLLFLYLRRTLPPPYAIAAAVMAFALAAPSLLARPHLLAWPCLVAWCGEMTIARTERRSPHLWLLPVMLLWVNLHGSFMLGLLLPVPLMGEALCESTAGRGRILCGWGGFILASWLTALANPALLSGVVFPFHHLGMNSLPLIGEWRPADFSRPTLLEGVILGAMALGFSGRVTVPPVRLAVILFLVHAALAHGRNEQVLGLAGVLLLAEPIGRALPVSRPSQASGLPTVAAVAVAASVLALRLSLPLQALPSGASPAFLDAVPLILRDRPVLNAYGLGGALIFNGIRPFIDSRADLYGDDFLAAYRKITAPDPSALRQAIEDHDLSWSIFPRQHPVNAALAAAPGWRLLTEAEGYAIYIRLK